MRGGGNVAAPRDLVAKIESDPAVVEGDDERFEGYGIMSAPFASGDILAMRRFPATSVGSAYTSVWHRTPDGRWHFYQNVAPPEACPRYFSADLSEMAVAKVIADWTGPRTFTVTVTGPVSLVWDISLRPSPVTLTLNAIGSTLPDAPWRSRFFLRVLGSFAGFALRAGHLGLVGYVPNGQWFIANPRLVWLVSNSSAKLDGHDLGPMGNAGEQARLGDFWLPTRGLFAIGRAFFETYDAARHQLPSAI